MTSPTIVPAETPLHELRDHMAASRQSLDRISRALQRTTGPGVLETANAAIGVNGYHERTHYRVPYASVAVINQSSSPIVVVSAAAQSAVPGASQGQFTVPAFGFVSLNMAGQAITFYGAVGATFSYSVMTSRIQPAAGLPGGISAQQVGQANGVASLNGAGIVPASELPPGFGLLAATPVAGVALVNGTPTILSYTFPADGNQHRVLLLGSVQVTSTETGGAVSGSVVPPNGGSPAQPAFLVAGQSTGNHVGTTAAIAGSGTTVSVIQSTALTGGAATMWAEIWGL
jgi:hypothetical protein